MLHRLFLIVLLFACMPLAHHTLAADESAPAAETQAARIDINSADVRALMALPGVGKVTAERIVAHRAEHGAFTSVEQLKQVKGIGPKTYEKIKDRVVATPPTATE